MARKLYPRYRGPAELDAWVLEAVTLATRKHGSTSCYRTGYLIDMARRHVGAKVDETRSSIKRLAGTRLLARTTAADNDEPCLQLTSRRGIAG